jgi:3',5'-cyclic AMP phosphodiesterase CpdA
MMRYCLLLILLSSCSAKPFRLVLLPDTQTYSRLYPEIFRAQTSWIAAHADSFAFVLQQGDLTDDNIPQQWKVAAEAMSLMDGKIPYTFAPGNHDLEGNAKRRSSDLFNTWFPYSKYSAMPGFGGAFETGKMDNTWHTFKAGGRKWLILSLEFGPRNSVLAWANSVVRQHPKHKIIYNMHAYMYSDDTRMGEGDGWLPQDYGVGADTGVNAVNNGEQIWEKLVSRHKNSMFVFSGHVLNDGTGRLVSNGVYQILANYQEGVKGSEKGGNGFLRIVTVKKRTIEVQTYSPWLNIFRTEPDQQFTLP